ERLAAHKQERHSYFAKPGHFNLAPTVGKSHKIDYGTYLLASIWKLPLIFMDLARSGRVALS
ncbi:hypothetical protein, partial [Mesorhizobium sp. WSM4315]|uniref:hypothetical protein n=1 Tax=Mesorhizobium sp. WSM4315 TaxID=2589882 RepID=UPI001AEEB372